MSEREETAKSVFATPKVVSCVLALVFPRQAEIRRRGNELEDALKADYGTPQVINSSDDAPQEVPRFLIPSKLDFPHLHGGADQVSPCWVSSARSCRDFSHFTPEHRYAKSRTRSIQGTEEAQEAL